MTKSRSTVGKKKVMQQSTDENLPLAKGKILTGI